MPEANKRKKDEKVSNTHWAYWLLIAVSAGLFALGAAAQSAAASSIVFPAAIKLSPAVLMATIVSIGVLGTLVNFYVMFRVVPNTIEKLIELFSGKGHYANLSKLQVAGLVISGFFALSTGMLATIFTFVSVPSAIDGLATLFGFGLGVLGPATIPIAAILAVIQGIMYSAMLYNNLAELIVTPASDGPSWSEMTIEQRCGYVGKIVFSVIGCSLTVIATLFSVSSQANSFVAMLKAWNVDEMLSKVFSVGFVWIGAALTLVALAVKSAINIFGLLGKNIFQAGYRLVTDPMGSLKSFLVGIRNGFDKIGESWQADRIGFLTSIAKGAGFVVIGVVGLVALLVNGIGNGMISTRGDKIAHGFLPHSDDFHKKADDLENHLISPYDATPAKLGIAEVIALVSGSVNSIVLCGAFALSHVMDLLRGNPVENQFNLKVPYSNANVKAQDNRAHAELDFDRVKHIVVPIILDASDYAGIIDGINDRAQRDAAHLVIPQQITLGGTLLESESSSNGVDDMFEACSENDDSVVSHSLVDTLDAKYAALCTNGLYSENASVPSNPITVENYDKSRFLQISAGS